MNNFINENKNRQSAFNRKALAIEILVVLAIVAGYFLITGADFREQPIYTIFISASVVYLINRYVFYYLFVVSRSWNYRKSTPLPAEELTPNLNDMLFTARARVSSASGDENIVYRFLHILYVPLIPIGCYEDRFVEMNSRDHFRMISPTEWRWAEVVYIYLKCWSTFIILSLTLCTLLFEYL